MGEHGEMKLVAGMMPKDHMPYQAYRCSVCHEEVMTMKQLRKLSASYRRLRHATSVTLSTWGNSLAVRIPHEIAAELKWKSGTQGSLVKEKGGIRITQTL